MGKATKEEAAESLAALKAELVRGDTVITVRRHRTTSGATYFDLYVFRADSEGRVSRRWLSWHAAKIGIARFNDKRDCLVYPYLNMDPGFEAVYRLSQKLFDGDGYALRHEWL